MQIKVFLLISKGKNKFEQEKWRNRERSHRIKVQFSQFKQIINKSGFFFNRSSHFGCKLLKEWGINQVRSKHIFINFMCVNYIIILETFILLKIASFQVFLAY